MERSNPPRRAIAILLACLGPGLGQLYLGRSARGFVLLALGLLFVPIAVISAHAGPSPSTLALLLLSAAIAILALVVGLVDAAVPRADDGLRPPPTGTQVLVALAALVVVGLLEGVGGALWVRSNLYEAFRIPSKSMMPTIRPGDHVLVGKQTRWDRPLARGDVVVYRAPSTKGRAYIKRVVGLPGETISFLGQALLVDGKPFADLRPDGRGRRGVERYPDGGEVPVTVPSGAEPTAPVTVPADQVFVVGDNRGDSEDSRNHGPIGLGGIVGVVQYRYWPPGRLGVVR